MSKYMVFDVESVGLYGPAFAVGWIVVDENGTKQEEGFYWCRPLDATGRPQRKEDRDWVYENCGFIHDPNAPSPLPTGTEVREKFWAAWMRWECEKGALLCADVVWPVEANFLSDCIQDLREERLWDGPYPLIDIASVRLAVGLDPLAEGERYPNETPAHNPLSDARQSARLLIEALGRGGV